MRALVVSDIHGNLHALEAVLAAAESWDQLWNLGDAVGYGAYPNEVLDLLRKRATLSVRGNHDRVCAGLSGTDGFNPVAAEAARWTHAQLHADNLAWLRAVPQGPIRATADVLCAHGSPLDEDQYILSMRDAWVPLQRMGVPLAFFGHTHLQGAFLQNGADWEERQGNPGGGIPEQFALTAGLRALVNPGSVGQPRDRDARASFTIYEADEGTVRFCRVPYDVASAQAAIRRAGLPERLATRLEDGR